MMFKVASLLFKKLTKVISQKILQKLILKSCSFSDVCTIRLDFEAFSIVGPADTIETMGGKCTDTFQATSVSFNISIL